MTRGGGQREEGGGERETRSRESREGRKRGNRGKREFNYGLQDVDGSLAGSGVGVEHAEEWKRRKKLEGRSQGTGQISTWWGP